MVAAAAKTIHRTAGRDEAGLTIVKCGVPRDACVKGQATYEERRFGARKISLIAGVKVFPRRRTSQVDLFF